MDEPLTPEVIAEGRRLPDELRRQQRTIDGAWQVMGRWFETHGPALLDAAEKAKERGRLAVELNHIIDNLMAEVVGLRADNDRLHAVIRKAVEDLRRHQGHQHALGRVIPGSVMLVIAELEDAAVESRALPEGGKS